MSRRVDRKYRVRLPEEVQEFLRVEPDDHVAFILGEDGSIHLTDARPGPDGRTDGSRLQRVDTQRRIHLPLEVRHGLQLRYYDYLVFAIGGDGRVRLTRGRVVVD